MPNLKQILWAVGAGIAISLTTAIIGFLSTARLEISFDKLKGFEVTNLKTYTAFGSSVKFDLETSQPREFVAFWGMNYNGKTVLEKSDVHFKNFKLSSRIEGAITDHFPQGDVIFDIIGYYNSDRIVFSHRGPISGVGVYMLNVIQASGLLNAAYVGYAMVEDVKVEGKSDTWVTQCPFVMIARSDALQRYKTTDDAKKAFSILQKDCVEFKTPQTT